MKVQERIEQFMNQIPEGTLDKRYYSPVFDLLVALDSPRTEAYGFACMRLLELTTVIFKDGRSINNDQDKDMLWTGTISDIAHAISIVFAEVNSNHRWWASRYPSDAGQPEVEEALKDLKERLSTLSFIERFE